MPDLDLIGNDIPLFVADRFDLSDGECAIPQVRGRFLQRGVEVVGECGRTLRRREPTCGWSWNQRVGVASTNTTMMITATSYCQLPRS